VTAADYWVYDPRDPTTYNRLVIGRTTATKWRSSYAEHLVEYRMQYQHAIVIDYNHAASQGIPDTRAGGGIFLHAFGPGATRGCVSVAQSQMVRILRWLQPSPSPYIVISVA
jgi:L,D-peptidoglycan transpeptidase YkuD (ErfK/YbiS/YcfS/YnhG family)